MFPAFSSHRARMKWKVWNSVYEKQNIQTVAIFANPFVKSFPSLLFPSRLILCSTVHNFSFFRITNASLFSHSSTLNGILRSVYCRSLNYLSPVRTEWIIRDQPNNWLAECANLEVWLFTLFLGWKLQFDSANSIKASLFLKVGVLFFFDFFFFELCLP